MHEKRCKKPPSRVRYEKNHPVKSFRIDKEWDDEFTKFLNEQGWSVGDFFRVAFKKQKGNYRRVYAKGYDEGRKDFAIWYYCSICRKIIYMRPNSESHKAMIRYMKEGGWGHSECHKKNTDF